MKTPSWRHPEILETWAAFEAMRRLGFKSKDLYFMVDKAHLHIQLQTQGKTFTYQSGRRPARASDERINEMWQGMVTAMNTGEFTEAEALAFWKQSRIAQLGTALLLVLQAKGIRVPAIEKIRAKRAN